MGEADIVQSRMTDFQLVDGVRNDLSAPLTPLNLRFELVSSNTLSIFRRIVEKYHSYVPSPYAVGRQVNFLIYVGNKPVGCIGIASAPILMRKCLLEYFRPFSNKVMKGQGNKVDITPIYNQIANNWRFTLTPEAPINSGSRCLSILCRLGAKEWKRKYGDNLRWVITFVGSNKEGTIYRGAGWKYLGDTSGRKLVDSTPFSGVSKSITSKEIKTDIKKIYLNKLR